MIARMLRMCGAAMMAAALLGTVSWTAAGAASAAATEIFHGTSPSPQQSEQLADQSAEAAGFTLSECTSVLQRISIPEGEPEWLDTLACTS
jgi:hypothetical protein